MSPSEIAGAFTGLVDRCRARLRCDRFRFIVQRMMFLAAFGMPVLAAEEHMPAFIGFLASSESEPLFALRWRNSTGGTFQTWLRLEEHAGDFKLRSFDRVAQVLTVEDSLGRRHRLTLPEGRVEPALSDDEFHAWIRFLPRDADKSKAPC
jgi:hypothetical protein